MKHTLIDSISEYIEGLLIPQGRYYGMPFELLKWQRRFLKGAFSVPGDAALSVGRGNGKTTFTAAIAAAALNGPLAEPNAETVIIASSFEQALISFRFVQWFLRPAIEREPRRFRVQDSVNRASITDRTTGAMVRALGSDPRRLHGLGAKLILADEMAQWLPTQVEAIVAALSTTSGKIENSKMVMLGTRAANPRHPFELALNGAAAYSQIHAAQPNDPPFQRRTWLKANPGLDHLPDLEVAIRREADLAKRDTDRQSAFRALRLNQGVSDTSETFVIDPERWESIEGEADAVGAPIFGVDLGTSAAQSCVSAYWQATGRLETIAAFPTIPNLRDRGITDGVGSLYEQCAARGELVQLGERVSDVRALLTEALERFGLPLAVVCDRWRIAELTQELEALGVYVPVVQRGMGFKDGAEDVRSFREACLTDKVTPAKSLLMRSAIREGRCVSDPAGNEKLAKGGQGGRRSKARDDALAAAILAIASGFRDIQSRLSAPAWDGRLTVAR